MFRKMSDPRLAKHMAQLTELPEGFSITVETEMQGHGKFAEEVTVYCVKSETIELRFDATGIGHTNFKVNGIESTFDRYGVDYSFYHSPQWAYDDAYDLNEIVREQIERVEKYLAKHAASVKIPGIPYMMPADRKEHYFNELENGKSVSFMPGGFGTGYVLAKGPKAAGKRAPKETEKFFGVAPLYIMQVEVD